MGHSSHRPAFRGCCAMCAAAKGKLRGQPVAEREKPSDLRARGRQRRLGRHDIPADQVDDGTV